MAVPTYEGAGAASASTGAIEVALPAGATTNDIMVLAVESNGNQPASAPANWTEFPDSPAREDTPGGVGIAAFWKRHDGSETNPTVADTGNHTHGRIHLIRGCITTGDPFDVTAQNVDASADTNCVAAGDTTTVNDCLIVIMAANGTDTTTPQFQDDWTNTDLADINQQTDDSTDAGGGGGMAFVTATKATAGAFGTTAGTIAANSACAAITVAFKPAAGGTNDTVTLPAAGIIALTGTGPSLVASSSVPLPAAGTISLTGGAPTIDTGGGTNATVTLLAAGIIRLGGVAPVFATKTATALFNPFIVLMKWMKGGF